MRPQSRNRSYGWQQPKGITLGFAALLVMAVLLAQSHYEADFGATGSSLTLRKVLSKTTPIYGKWYATTRRYLPSSKMLTRHCSIARASSSSSSSPSSSSDLQLLQGCSSSSLAHRFESCCLLGFRRRRRKCWRPSYAGAGRRGVHDTSIDDTTKVFTIAGDIGGTNSRFALYLADLGDDKEGKMLCNMKYQNMEFDSFADVLQKFLIDAEEETDISQSQVVSAAFAIAGPVFDNSVKFTNLDKWPEVSGEDLGKMFGMKVEIINDFVGLSQGLVTLEDKDTMILQKGHQMEKGVKVCIGAGTGLGESYLTYNSDIGQYEAWPSEGGHSDFVPRTTEQLAMTHWIRAKIYPEQLADDLGARISVERVCSGGGLVNTYEFLRSYYPQQIDKQLDAIYEAAGEKEKPAVITEYGTRNMSSLMGHTVTIFLSTLGTEIANSALKFLPYGGIYIAGGIIPKLVEKYTKGIEACEINNPQSCSGAILNGYEIYKTLKRDAKNKGRMGTLLEKIPVFLVVVHPSNFVTLHPILFISMTISDLPPKRMPI